MLVRCLQEDLTPRLSFEAVSKESSDVMCKMHLRGATGYDSFVSTYENELQATAPPQVLHEADRHAMSQPWNVSELDEGSLQQFWLVTRGWYAAPDGMGIPTTCELPEVLPRTLCPLLTHSVAESQRAGRL